MLSARVGWSRSRFVGRFLLLGAAFLVPGMALAQSADPPAQVSVDKSQFDLFDPTPDQDLRQFTTDRPGKANGPTTVDAGHFQIETDIWDYTWDHYSSDSTTSRATTLFDPDFKVGLNNWAEFDIYLPLYNTTEQRSRTGGGIAKASGFGDILAGGKVNFFGNDGGNYALGAIGLIKIPTAASGLGNDMVEFNLGVPLQITLPAKFSLLLEAQANLLRNENKQGYQGDYQFIANLSRPVIGDVVTAALEIAIDEPSDHNVGRSATLDETLQWLLTPNLQIDGGLNIGITENAADWNPYVGISARF